MLSNAPFLPAIHGIFRDEVGCRAEWKVILVGVVRRAVVSRLINLQDHATSSNALLHCIMDGPLSLETSLLWATEIVGVDFSLPLIELRTFQIHAVSSLHSAEIMHRAIHPESIMVTSLGHILLIDFGQARLCEDVDPVAKRASLARAKSHQSLRSRKSLALMFPPSEDTVCIAPEVILGWTHDFGVDVWGIGVVLWCMLVDAVCCQLSWKHADTF